MVDRRTWWIAALGLGVACLGDRALVGDETSDGGTSPTSTSTGDVATSDGTSASSDGTTSSLDTSDGDTTTPGCSGFLCPHDIGDDWPCNVWAQDCPPGEKCMPWANDGGSAWNAMRCSPIDPTPADIGEPCTVVDSAVSGIDDCPRASMCWNVDSETNTGTCFDFCRGSEANPTCIDPASNCVLTGEGTLILCFPLCDPLAQDCGEQRACYPVNDIFTCAPDASGEMGGPGEGCESINVCDPGLHCADASLVPDCTSYACCNPFCDLAAADPDADCLPEQICLPWYELGQAPPSLVDVGACTLPQ